MAAGGLFALLDDLASIMDDVAVMAKVAVKKTAGVAGDDLAVGAEQVVGLDPSRELPIVWAIGKASMFNKFWLVPSALLLSAFAPWSIIPIMMFGGAFLCYEGVEKILHRLSPKEEAAHKDELAAAAATSAESLMALEKEKIAGAVRTDVVLSAEIVVIALGAVASMPFGPRALVLSIVAIGMTIAIYGLIALIVKADDLGLAMTKRRGFRGMGKLLLLAMPPFMKVLSVVGTAAMFLVGGGILVHGIPGLEALFASWTHAATSLTWLRGVIDFGLTLGVGIVAGLIAIPVFKLLALIGTGLGRTFRWATSSQ